MNIDSIITHITEANNETAVISDSIYYSFFDIFKKYNEYKNIFYRNEVTSGSIVAVISDFNSSSIAVMLLLINMDCIIVPISTSIKNVDYYTTTAECEFIVTVINDDIEIKNTGELCSHTMLTQIKKNNTPGIILFSSGTTGKPKAALHDMRPLIEQIKNSSKKKMRTITFLLFDHIGGFNTMMHALNNGNTIIAVKSRDPRTVCQAIETHKAELLPTSPTFINMLLLDGLHRQYDLSSLRMITYGTEPMPESTLKRIHRALPECVLKQTYGLSEVGIMPTKSENSNSLWIKIGGEGYETKIIDNILFIKSRTAMLGYLNAPSPFDEDGWFNTKDKIEVRGDYLRILGRVTDIINVGGEKVYPIEVESVLLECDGVVDVRIAGERNILMGQTVAAVIQVAPENNNRAFIKKLRAFCAERLEKFKIPVKITLVGHSLGTERLKKAR